IVGSILFVASLPTAYASSSTWHFSAPVATGSARQSAEPLIQFLCRFAPNRLRVLLDFASFRTCGDGLGAPVGRALNPISLSLRSKPLTRPSRLRILLHLWRWARRASRPSPYREESITRPSGGSGSDHPIPQSGITGDHPIFLPRAITRPRR